MLCERLLCFCVKDQRPIKAVQYYIYLHFLMILITVFVTCNSQVDDGCHLNVGCTKIRCQKHCPVAQKIEKSLFTKIRY